MRIDQAGMTPELRQQYSENQTQHRSVPANQDATRPVDEIDKDQVKKAVDQLNDFAKPHETSLRFKFHEALEEYYVEVVDPATDQVIKEIPPKKMLDMYAAMTEFIGILEDKKI